MDSSQKVWIVYSGRDDYSGQAAFPTMQAALDFLEEKADDDLSLYWLPLIDLKEISTGEKEKRA